MQLLKAEIIFIIVIYKAKAQRCSWWEEDIPNNWEEWKGWNWATARKWERLKWSSNRRATRMKRWKKWRIEKKRWKQLDEVWKSQTTTMKEVRKFTAMPYSKILQQRNLKNQLTLNELFLAIFHYSEMTSICDWFPVYSTPTSIALFICPTAHVLWLLLKAPVQRCLKMRSQFICTVDY